MTILNKIYGGAGCGKTYHLMEELEKLVSGGVDARDISMMTLTRAARREFLERATKITDCDEKTLQWFGTMHQLTWRMLKLSFKQHAVTTARKKEFFEDYEKEPSGKLPNLVKINEVRRNCMEENNKAGLLQTQRITGLNFIYRDESDRFKDLRIDEIIEFGNAWNEFLAMEDLYDFTKMIEIAHNDVRAGALQPQFEFMMVDEFQDFSPLQHALYSALTDHMEVVWFCGDDWQVIYRFAGASPEFLINNPVTTGHELVLPKTWRYGADILENSLKYVEGLALKKDRDIEPADRDSRVLSLYGTTWGKHIKTDESTSAYLVRTNKQVSMVAAELDNRGIVYGLLGSNNSRIETLLKNYNTIATLERDEKVIIDDIKILIKSLPVATELTDAQVTLTGERSVKKMQLLKRGIKTHIDNPDYLLSLRKDFYMKDDFAESFFAGWSWSEVELLDHVKEMREFIKEKGLRFPEPFDMKINHHIGTIHKFKGNEADNVFLFRQMPYPISENVLYNDMARDDERRCFYVGATRARFNLFEIDGYFADYYGNVIPSVGEIL